MAADSPLDAYSRVVSGVAAELTPKVASLRITHPGERQREMSIGSAVIQTDASLNPGSSGGALADVIATPSELVAA
jgi:S1-C subfamily serine protease